MAEESGFDSIWIAEDYYLRDSITLLSCAAYATEKIKLGSGIINPFSRHPALIAQTAATLSELSKGRFTLGLGSGEQKILGTMGIQVDHPLRSMRESIGIIRTLLEGKQVDFQGSDFRVSQVKLGSNPYISRSREDEFGKKIYETKIYLAAIGPRMLNLSAKIADGVLLSAGASCETARQSIAKVRGARAKYSTEGRPFISAGYVGVCLSEPSIGVKMFVADLANIWPQNFLEAAVDPKQISELQEDYARKGLEGAVQRVTQEMIRAVVAIGSVSEVEEKVSEYVSAGVEQPILIPIGTSAKDLIRTFAI